MFSQLSSSGRACLFPSSVHRSLHAIIPNCSRTVGSLGCLFWSCSLQACIAATTACGWGVSSTFGGGVKFDVTPRDVCVPHIISQSLWVVMAAVTNSSRSTSRSCSIVSWLPLLCPLAVWRKIVGLWQVWLFCVWSPRALSFCACKLGAPESVEDSTSATNRSFMFLNHPLARSFPVAVDSSCC